MMKELADKSVIRTTATIALCFLLTSTGWLSWEYHLLDQVSTVMSDTCTMVIGYLLQAAGIGLYALLLKVKPVAAERVFPGALLIHFACMIPAVLSPYTIGTLVFGFLMNLFCGIIAGYYLTGLTCVSPAGLKATVFGIAYGFAIFVSWILSQAGQVYYSGWILIVCAALTAAALLIYARSRDTSQIVLRDNASRNDQIRDLTRRDIVRVCVLVFLLSMINSSGFAFPASDLGKGVSPELLRLVYAAGLIIAGIVTDRSRKIGAVCAVTALMLPFIILALSSESLSAVILWSLSYFTFGFYAVYRVILFSDIAAGKGLVYLSVFGLMIGRIGDASGEIICLLMGEHLTARVILTALLFAAAVALFLRLYQTLYIPAPQQETEKERFARFAAAHDLTPREQDLMHLILRNMTVAEIADELIISENTVKYHIRNILQKTGCKNRNELVTTYTAR